MLYSGLAVAINNICGVGVLVLLAGIFTENSTNWDGEENKCTKNVVKKMGSTEIADKE